MNVKRLSCLLANHCMYGCMGMEYFDQEYAKMYMFLNCSLFQRMVSSGSMLTSEQEGITR